MTMDEIAAFCERNDLLFSLTYGDGDAVWDIDITDRNHIVYSSFVYKGELDALLADAMEATKKYITDNIQKDI